MPSPEAMGASRNINFLHERSPPQSSQPQKEDEVELLQIPDFWSALTAIVVIDLVLAGDNAIVIALAARKLSPLHRRRAIVWGTVGAVAIRATLTVAVLWLLQLPGLMFTGGILLLVIAYQVLTGTASSSSDRGIAPAAGFWGAMRTIVVADAVMGMDNVVGVAGASHGNVLLVVLGLAISIPIVIWGSSLILECIGRFPGLLYAGGAVLVWTATHMIASEPFVRDLLAAHSGSAPLVYATAVAAVLGSAWLRNRRLQLQSQWK